jgi:hypothetical protein
VRRRLLPSSHSSRGRPQISAPTDFRHIHSESFRFPDYGPPQPQTQPPARTRPRSFRPIELSIYGSDDNQLSPILPHFDYPSPPVTPPQRAFTHSTGSPDTFAMSHERSQSTLSFHIPRKPTNTGSVFDSPRSDSTITRPSPARVRAYTSPSPPTSAMGELIERVAKAMVERDRLQERIEDVIERQSIYVSSRPSSPAGRQPSMAYSISDMEPMPDIPALPPNAPSFSQRLTSDRPSTAPTRPVVASFARSKSGRQLEGRAPPPPLPLRLRPPLRKKKSFSRVSTWLGFPGDPQHSRDISLDSITNAPKPVNAGDGFYQIATAGPRQARQRSSFESYDSVSDWTSSGEELEEEEQTVPTSASPSSSTTIKAMAFPFQQISHGMAPQRRSVGVAF